MPELSKTAKASMGKQYKEVHVETTEEAIHAIRVNRDGGLHIGDMSRVDKLLAAYDALVKESTVEERAEKELEKALPTIKKLIEDPEFLKGVKASGYRLNVEEIGKFFTDHGFENPIVSMAEVPAQEEDPGHLEDFNR